MKYNLGYANDSIGRVVPNGARTVNLAQLKEILKSTDKNLFESNQWIWDGEFRFLDGEKIDKRVGLTSYLRSGNSFLRRYIE